MNNFTEDEFKKKLNKNLEELKNGMQENLVKEDPWIKKLATKNKDKKIER